MKLLLLFCSVALPLSVLAQNTPPPPREVKLVETKFDKLSNHEIEGYGKQALEIAPQKWKHAETNHFIFHYRRVTEAQRVVRELEYDLWFVAKTLKAGPDRYAKKSHVYIFQDSNEWALFLEKTESPSWFGSFAYGDTLFLHVGGAGEGFDSHGLAHEATHAVVARLYPKQRWPLWLNEGFAEYMGTASVAARKQQYLKGMQRNLPHAALSLQELISMPVYPTDQEKVGQLYQTSEKLVRFLMTKFPEERIVAFIETIVKGTAFETAIVEVYGDKVKDYAAFERQYSMYKE